MSVLCVSNLRAPKRRPIGLYYPFSKFEADIAFLDSLLKRGGLLVVAVTTYRFCDTSTAKRYEGIPVEYRLPQERRTFYPDGYFGRHLHGEAFSQELPCPRRRRLGPKAKRGLRIRLL
jgi:hypothetical protein